jgi:hypothetical protein
MKSLKQEVLQAISSLPDDTPIDDIMYRLYVIDKIRKGQEAIKDGQKISSEELKREIETW